MEERIPLLRLAEFDTQPCRTAEQGLEHLRKRQFDLVLTDYMLPQRTGGWLLQQAAREGLLERLAGGGKDVRPPRARRRSSPPGGGNGHADCPEPIELILYVSPHSVRSAAAIANVRKALGRYKSNRVRLTIHDLSQDPAQGIDDSIAFTRALVKRGPGPRTFILGHITNPDLVLELLDECE